MEEGMRRGGMGEGGEGTGIFEIQQEFSYLVPWHGGYFHGLYLIQFFLGFWELKVCSVIGGEGSWYSGINNN